ncbi:MAG: hypothetical protein RID09_08495 [Coleofasciculus sp. G1-WW12-02]|uniref:hypothetical protein n=1 Tax=Coleofasciculus sp. G1-WW12-02 TaxID=3068483 RepID=UPI0033014BA3
MRTIFWDTYTPETFFLLYPVSSGFSLNSWRSWGRYSRRRCGNRPCPIPRTQSLASLPSEASVLTAIKHGNQSDTNEEEDKEPNITDIMIPMGLDLPNLVEPYQVLYSNSHIPYSQHYPLYHFWRKAFGHLD